jgi:hypothetical protein
MAMRGSCLCGGVTFEIDRACGPAEYDATRTQFVNVDSCGAPLGLDFGKRTVFAH